MKVENHIARIIAELRLDEEEARVFLKSLEEFTKSEEGNSETLDYLFNIDYDEQPVSIDTFIESSDYLGGVLDNGKNIYPYWRQVMRDIFDENKGYQEVIFSGAIGVGKSTIAAICMAYILHHLLCLRRPQRYYGLPDSSYLAFAFINLTLDAAFGIGVRKFMDLLKLSPWFLRHGKLVGKTGSETYAPSKGVDILGGSLPRHTIGRDVFCMTGDTLIPTTLGLKSLYDLSYTRGRYGVYTVGSTGEVFENYSHLGCKLVDEESELLEIELENGKILRVTGDHQFKLADGSWKCAKDLEGSEELAEFELL